MKIKRILSSALLIVMLFTTIIAAIPVTAGAAYSGSSEDNVEKLSLDDIKDLVKEVMNYDFKNAQQMLDAEIEKGYITSATSDSGEYTIYVNRYTGFMYYRNNLTGQILTSNPYQYSTSGNLYSETIRRELTSQIVVNFSEISSSQTAVSYNSSLWSAAYGQISTQLISDGIRVNYTLGDTTARFLLPGRMLAPKFEELILIPLAELLEEAMEKYCREGAPDTNFSFLENEKYTAYEFGCISAKAYQDYAKEMFDICKKQYKSGRPEYKEILAYYTDMKSLGNRYTLQNPGKYADEPEDKKNQENSPYQRLIKTFYTPAKGMEDLPVYKELLPMYTLDASLNVADKRTYSAKFQNYAGEDYTFENMYADEAECGYIDSADTKPVFRCALEYSFNADGSLSVRLPANSITFDETRYILNYISPIRYFGAGDMSSDGYLFFPDGSGTVMEFDDFYSKSPFDITANVFGDDYAYSEVTGKHHEQISMPVYGIVNTVAANETTKLISGKDTVRNGFFAIIEEGESLATLGFKYEGQSHKYSNIYASYTPYPSDKYDLSDTVSVGGATFYTMTAETKYNGSYVTRIVMLADEAIGETFNVMSGGSYTYYPASYVGMATYYRNLLKEDGTLTALENVNENLPLYIESFGSIEIIKKILTFPVTTKIPLTTFEDVYTIYSELADAKNKMKEKAAEYEKMAAETEDESLKTLYQQTADEYLKLSEESFDIKNINFRLTGFGNGGMYYTYPTKVRWDKACGGKSGFNELMEKAKAANFGIFPDYDFLYIENTEAFDGISIKGNVSRMIDNRYASKQVYNSIIGQYESFFSMVINPAALEKLYDKFIDQYSEYEMNTISVATLGSDLNSNFDEDEMINRDEAQGYVMDMLNKMAYQENYSIMTDVGNVYSLKYVDHILNFCTDSSHIRYTSYSVPFVGMVLHGYVNYAGSPINYAGNAEYNLLRAIESGASLYYILCYQNTAFMKEDPLLNKYYGVDYANWYDNIVATYAELNKAIGSLQDYEIVDHQIIIGERVIDSSEAEENLALLKEEILKELASEIQDAVDKAYKNIRESEAAWGTAVELVINKTALMAQFADILGYDSAEEIADADFEAGVDAIIAEFEAEYAVPETNTLETYKVNVDYVDYDSAYDFITDSVATDKYNYVHTDYTSDVGNIVLVTYSNGIDTCQFIINYNMYTVNVILEEGAEPYAVGMYSYVKIEG